MTLLLNVAIYTLWLFPLVVQAAIVFGMIRRKLVKSFPIFFTYTVVVFFSDTGLLLFQRRGGNLYHRLYSYKEAAAVVLGLAVIFEVLRYILPPYTSPRFVFNLIRVLSGVFAISALLMLVVAKPTTGNDPFPMFEVIALTERSVRFLQASLLIVVIALMSALGLTWQHESLGILAGFGIYSAMALAAFEFGAHLRWMSLIAFSLVNSAGYNVAVLIWAFYILRPRRTKPIERLPNDDLEEWNDALSSYVSQRSHR
jgi:hypothetical protein